MLEEERSRPAGNRAAESNAITSVESSGRPWDDGVDWWADPAYAYLRGLQDGARLVEELREELRRYDEGADAVHRDATRKARQFIDAADRRRAYELQQWPL